MWTYLELLYHLGAHIVYNITLDHDMCTLEIQMVSTISHAAKFHTVISSDSNLRLHQLGMPISIITHTSVKRSLTACVMLFILALL